MLCWKGSAGTRPEFSILHVEGFFCFILVCGVWLYPYVGVKTWQGLGEKLDWESNMAKVVAKKKEAKVRLCEREYQGGYWIVKTLFLI